MNVETGDPIVDPFDADDGGESPELGSRDEEKSRIWSSAFRPAPPEEATESFVLLERHKRGERDAGEDLARRYQDGLTRYARVLLGARLRRTLDSGDITNEVFLEALPKLKDFDYRGPGSVLRYLKTMARHRIQNLGNRARIPQVDGDPRHDPFWLGLEQTSEEPAAEELARRELQAILDEAASRLPPRDRELVSARHYLGRSWEEIQAEMEFPSRAAAEMAYLRAKLRWMELAGKRLRDWIG